MGTPHFSMCKCSYWLDSLCQKYYPSVWLLLPSLVKCFYILGAPAVQKVVRKSWHLWSCSPVTENLPVALHCLSTNLPISFSLAKTRVPVAFGHLVCHVLIAEEPYFVLHVTVNHMPLLEWTNNPINYNFKDSIAELFLRARYLEVLLKQQQMKSQLPINHAFVSGVMMVCSL